MTLQPSKLGLPRTTTSSSPLARIWLPRPQGRASAQMRSVARVWETPSPNLSPKI